MSQNTKILEHLKTGKPIDPINALTLYGCRRLPARIQELREVGWVIITETMRSSGTSRYSRYRLAMRRV